MFTDVSYRWLFIKGNVFIGEWGIFGAEVFLHYSQFFIKGDFIIGGVECRYCIFEQLPILSKVQNVPPKVNTDVNEINPSPTDFAADIEKNITLHYSQQ